jgi:antitoxin (DNA-binding transcriptional repressor) of toxin-antitoxin stability system
VWRTPANLDGHIRTAEDVVGHPSCVCSTSCYSVCVSEQISQRELRNDSGRIMRALDDGSSFVITRNGRPVGELRPLRRDRFVDAVTVAEVFRHAPPLDWEAMREDLDRHGDQDANPRA